MPKSVLARLAQLSHQLTQLGERQGNDEALDCIADVLSVKRASIMAFDEQGVMRFRAWRGISREYRRAVERHSPWTPSTRGTGPLFIPDVRQEGDLEPFREVLEAETIRGLAFFPLIVTDHAVGEIALYFDEVHELDGLDVEIAKIVAAHVGFSIQHAADTKRLEDKSRELEATMARKDQFMAVLGHELRNPLSTTLLALDYMAQQREHEDVFVRERAVMQRQLTHLTRLVDDLLDLSRIARGKLSLEKKRLPVREAVHNAVETTQARADECGHEITVDVPEGLEVHADPGRLTQMIANLLSNAVKYSPNGSRITVEARRNEQLMVLSVCDDGEGMDEALLSQIFEPFHQGRDGRRGGLGVGLSIVKNFAELHGGRIEAHSDGPGTGSRFTLTLPG